MLDALRFSPTHARLCPPYLRGHVSTHGILVETFRHVSIRLLRRVVQLLAVMILQRRFADLKDTSKVGVAYPHRGHDFHFAHLLVGQSPRGPASSTFFNRHIKKMRPYLQGRAPGCLSTAPRGKNKTHAAG